jgi:hypothetical protein
MTLNQREESFVRQMVKDHTPLVAQNPVQTGESKNHVSIDATIDRALASTPKMMAADLNDDPFIESKVRHTMRKDEKLGQWYARVGLGRSAILAMSRDEITEFAEQAEVNNRDAFVPRSDPRDAVVGAPVHSRRFVEVGV